MDLTIPVIIFVFVLIGIPVISVVLIRAYQIAQIKKARAEQAEIEQRMKAGVLAAAAVVSARVQSAHEAGGMILMRLVLRVELPGGESYTAAVTWEVDSIMQNSLQPGAPISVKIDPDDPKKVYPNVSWATYSLAAA